MNATKMILQTRLTTHLPIHVVLTLPLLVLNYRLSTYVFNWFDNNHLKANPGKWHLLRSTKSPEVVSIDGIQITTSAAEPLIIINTDITFDSELNFETIYQPYVTRWAEKLMLLGGLSVICLRKNAVFRWKHFLNLRLTTAP